MNRRTPNHNRRCLPRGAAAAETAIALPLLLLLFFGAVELSRAIHVQHSLQEAAQAAARVYCIAEGSQQQAEQLAATAMSKAGISGYSIRFDPATKTEIDVEREPVTVTLSVPYSRVTWISPFFLRNITITGSCVMPADLAAASGP